MTDRADGVERCGIIELLYSRTQRKVNRNLTHNQKHKKIIGASGKSWRSVSAEGRRPYCLSQLPVCAEMFQYLLAYLVTDSSTNAKLMRRATFLTLKADG